MKDYSLEEDEKIKTLYVKYNGNWSKIAREIPGRSAKEIRARYNFYLSPLIKSSEWSVEENQLLANCFQNFGKKWELYSQFFPNKSTNSIKNKVMSKYKFMWGNTREEKDLDDVIPFR